MNLQQSAQEKTVPLKSASAKATSAKAAPVIYYHDEQNDEFSGIHGAGAGKNFRKERDKRAPAFFPWNRIE